MVGETFYLISEVAKKVGLTRQRVYKYVEDGRLKTVKRQSVMGPVQMVTASELARFTRALNGKKGKK